MLRRMLGVDSWLDVASLENVEEDHSFLFLKKNSMKIFFFFFKFGNLEFFQGIENFDWWFFFFLKQPKKYEPNALSPKALFEFFFFLKNLEVLNFFMELKILIDFFFFEKFRNLEFFQGIENFELFFFFWKIWKSWIFSWK